MTNTLFISGVVLGSANRLSPPGQNHQVPLGGPPPQPQTPDSRRVIVHTTSKSISGAYPLYDLLSLSAQSGSISVSVTPHPASDDKPESQPASLEISGRSGSVHATLTKPSFSHHDAHADSAPFSDPPPSYWSAVGLADDADVAKDVAAQDDNARLRSGVLVREYTTSVSSRSGSISGTYPLGRRTSIESRSGSINGVELVVMPLNSSEPRQLKTAAHTGSQSVRIVEDSSWFPMAGAHSWWQGMASRHETQSGSLDLQYPASWQGTIEVDARSGSVSITGNGVEIVREDNGRYLARKGTWDGGKIDVSAGSGSVSLRFG